jgi:hypothetical protein
LAALVKIYGVSTAWITSESSPESDTADDRILLAARHLSKMKQEDLDRLMRLISMLRQPGASQ